MDFSFKFKDAALGRMETVVGRARKNWPDAGGTLPLTPHRPILSNVVYNSLDPILRALVQSA
jgi:hypothetical protein